MSEETIATRPPVSQARPGNTPSKLSRLTVSNPNAGTERASTGTLGDAEGESAPHNGPADGSTSRRRTRGLDVPGAELAALAHARITVPHIAQRPVMRRSPDGGRSFPRCSASGYRYEVELSTAPPTRPTSVPTGDRDSGTTRLLVLDLDASRVPPSGAGDRAAYIASVADQAVALVEECGGRALVDVSPSGGRHVYLLWAQPVRYSEMRTLAKAFALRFAPVVDTSPMEHTDGQIRGPGSPHKSVNGRLSGFMTLTASIDEAEAICAQRCDTAVWEALQIELTAELEVVTGCGPHLEARHPQAPDAVPGTELDLRGEPFRPRIGGRARVRPDLEQTARTRQWDRSRYATSSEVRQAILSSAAARGWRLEQVRTALGGEWAPIADWWRDDDRLRAEWAKAVEFTTSESPPSAARLGDSVRESNTSGIPITRGAPPPPAGEGGNGTAGTLSTGDDPERARAGNVWGIEVRSQPWELTVHQQIRVWQHAMYIVERHLELEWAGRALSYRAILRAIGAAAQMAGSTTVEFGTRQLAYMTGLDHTTVARALQALREGPYALISLAQGAEGVRADLYRLVVPDAFVEEATRRRFRSGRIDAIHPTFRKLGLGPAFMFEALSSNPASTVELTTAALLSKTTAYEALQTLAAHGLAERDAHGRWRRGPADLDVVAASLEADVEAEAHLREHREDRAKWHAYLGIISAGCERTEKQDRQGEGETGAPCTPRTPRNRSTSAKTPRAGGTVSLAPGEAQRRQRRRQAVRTRPAPAWLKPPRRLVTESDLGCPPEIQAVLDQVAAEESSEAGSRLSADLYAVIAEDLAVICADEDHQIAERSAYEHELAVMRRIFAPTILDHPSGPS
ncbi:hypothetical protein ACQEU3_43935 [Spirillospora sp. CA-253888]